MELIYILTYNCNFRCKYCDVFKHDNNISKQVLDNSFTFLSKTNFDIKKVKFFGGEPLLKKEDIKYIVEQFPSIYKPSYYITTNTTLIEDNFINFCKKNLINLTFSIDGDSKILSENRILYGDGDLSEQIISNTKKYIDFIKVNQVITSQNSKDFFSNFKYIYDLGVRKFNFLPAYYIEWSKEGFKNLKDGFDQILDFHKLGNSFELVNLENYSDISFFNLGIIIDTDGSIYGSNLILSKKFEKYKKDLLIGNVFSGLKFDINNTDFKESYIKYLGLIIKKEYSLKELKSVEYVDFILNNFCYEYSNKK